MCYIARIHDKILVASFHVVFSSYTEFIVCQVGNGGNLMGSRLLIFQVVSELTGKDLETLIKEGSEKLASVPSGGGAAPAAAAAAAPAAGGAAEKKEEKKEEEEEEDEDMGFGLFD